MSWDKAGQDVPHEFAAVWEDNKKNDVGKYHYSINSKGKSLRTDIEMSFTFVKEKTDENDASMFESVTGGCDCYAVTK